MRKIPVDKVREGMTLARPVYGYDGNVLLNTGMMMKMSYINKLKELDIFELYIDDEISRDIIITDVISDETRFEARLSIKNAMESIRFGNTLDLKPIRNSVGKMIDELLQVKDAVVCLQDIKSKDQYTFFHSVNVCVLSVITGISMNYDQEKLKELAMGAMLHDIGKVSTPRHVLNKPGPLTNEEYSVIKEHAKAGYETLKKSRMLSTYTSYIALTHHERVDGTGYPLGLKGNDIHDFTKIVTIADVYDAMTSDRVYKKRCHISEAVEYLVGMGYHQFDYDMVRRFIEHVTIYPPGTCVNLNTGEKAIVVDVNKKYPNRPIVRIVADRDGQPVKQPAEVDLTRNNNILINEILDDI